jgi:serine/threonine protein kinase
LCRFLAIPDPSFGPVPVQMEIDLLKMLQHKNIVHYIEHVCTDLQLSIIMEYAL